MISFVAFVLKSTMPSCYRYAVGARSAHGWASSSWPARRNSVVSSPKRPTNCMPIGSPASFQYSGTDMAGCPVTLNTAVQGMKSKVLLANGLITPSASSSQAAFSPPISVGGLQRAGREGRLRQRGGE